MLSRQKSFRLSFIYSIHYPRARDLALDMSYAEIKVYEDARKAGLTLTKLIIAKDKIRERVNALFPQNPKTIQ